MKRSKYFLVFLWIGLLGSCNDTSLTKMSQPKHENLSEDSQKLTSSSVLGWINGVSRSTDNTIYVSGWACAQSVNKSIYVHLYFDNEYKNGGKFIEAKLANMNLSSEVSKACGTSGVPHHFIFSLKDSNNVHAGRKVYVHGIHPSGGVNPIIGNSGTYVVPTSNNTPKPDSPSVLGWINFVSRGADDTVYVAGWACAQSVNKSIYVHLYFDNEYKNAGQFIQTKLANTNLSSEVSKACGTSGVPHNFLFSIKDSNKVHAGRKVYVHGIHPSGGINPIIGNSGIYMVPKRTGKQNITFRPKFGVIRWDMYAGDKNVTVYQEEKFLSNLNPLTGDDYRWRAPFYASVSDSNLPYPVKFAKTFSLANVASRFDQEMNYAINADIDYFIFGFQGLDTYTEKPAADQPIDGPDNTPTIGYSLKAYLKNSKNKLIKFSLYLSGAHFGNRLFYESASARKDRVARYAAKGLNYYEEYWKELEDDIVELTKHPSFQIVHGGRPLIYIHDIHHFATLLNANSSNGWLPLLNAINSLKNKVKNGMGKNPYIVIDYTIKYFSSVDLDYWMSKGIVDGVTAYHYRDKGTKAGRSYSYIWGDYKSDWLDPHLNKKYPLIPLVMSGADWSPRSYDEKLMGKFPFLHYTEPAMGANQIKNNVTNALNICKNQEVLCPTQTVVMYAWNEFSEGGFLCPLITPSGQVSTWRLDEVNQALTTY